MLGRSCRPSVPADALAAEGCCYRQITVRLWYRRVIGRINRFAIWVHTELPADQHSWVVPGLTLKTNFKNDEYAGERYSQKRTLTMSDAGAAFSIGGRYSGRLARARCGMQAVPRLFRVSGQANQRQERGEYEKKSYQAGRHRML
jgi:hypothetical protein